jgi:hypothetical protein
MYWFRAHESFVAYSCTYRMNKKMRHEEKKRTEIYVYSVVPILYIQKWKSIFKEGRNSNQTKSVSASSHLSGTCNVLSYVQNKYNKYGFNNLTELPS